MNFKVDLFIKTTVLCLATCCIVPGAFGADNTECLTGGIYEYCGWGSQCKPCPANCYCPPVSKRQVKCTGWTGISCSSSGIKSNTNSSIDNGSFGIHLCPSEYPTSDAGTKDSSKCYWKCSDGKTVYNESKTCSAGKYRPKGTNDCKDCPSDGKSICEGVSSFKPTCAGADSDKGIRTCDSGTIPNANKTACEKKKEEAPKKYKCITGEYLPANSTTCAACPEGSICFGGEWNVSVVDQGIQDSISVPAGKYLPANSTTPKECPKSDNKYCPGGDFKIDKSNQGIMDCPLNGRSNSTKTACTVILTKEQLQYGPNGKNTPEAAQCWLQENHAAFQACVLGIELEED